MEFYLYNVVDTCAIWNVMSSELLYITAKRVGVSIICTGFVHYECLQKPRKKADLKDLELMGRFKKCCLNMDVTVCNIDVQDLQEVEILRDRKKIGIGELSTIALAKKINQAVLTDDKKARRLAENILPSGYVQTTPRLVGWLFYKGELVDSDKDVVFLEHEKMARPLKKYFEEMYLEAMKCRLLQNKSIQENQ